MASDQSPGEGTPIPTTEVDGEGGGGRAESSVTDEQWTAMQTVLDTVYDFRTEDGHDPSKVFHRKVNKRVLPDYYQVITEPVALSTIKAKINQKTYIDFAEFVRDFALVVHNAQVYNRPDAGAYQDALEVKRLVETELKKFVDSGLITTAIATFPFLGEIPPQEDAPNEENDGGEEEEGNDDSGSGGDDSEDVENWKKNKVRIRTKVKTEEGSKEDAQAVADSEFRKKTGRPPKVFTPLEARIYNILKGMRRPKNESDEPIANAFDRLPDRGIMPGYYDEIKSPMAIDILKRKHKRKKYNSVDEFMADANLMFENAKLFNEDDSQIYRDAVTLQRETQRLAEVEKQRPDTEFVTDDGRLPLPEGIVHRGEHYRIGDWVLIQNKNDLTKPIVSQIYRTWQDAQGNKFVNACWYYRPEQTVHRYDKHFYDHEVVKTGQYRDHSVEEIVDRCFVMFITRFSKGRPRGFPRDKEIYVCEGRYNEDKYTINKIKTWASCLPDEVRDKDYEMELYHEPKRMKKIPSPIAYLLKDSQKETDDFPQPEWGADNAPPKIGAVHRRPREGKESPPPERTPTPPRASIPAPARITQQAQPNMNHSHPSSYSRGPNPNFMPTPARQAPTSAASSHAPGSQAPMPHMRHYQPMQISPAPSQQQPHIARVNSYSSHTPQALPNAASRMNPSDFVAASRYQPPAQNSLYSASMNNASSTVGGGYKAPQPIEVWSLNDAANAAIPADIREQFQQDEQGRVLFFTAPPLDTKALARRPSTKEEAEEPLGHSVEYLAKKAERDQKVREHRKRKAEKAAEAATLQGKRVKVERDEFEQKLAQVTAKAVDAWENEMYAGTEREFDQLYGRAEGAKVLATKIADMKTTIASSDAGGVDV